MSVCERYEKVRDRLLPRRCGLIIEVLQFQVKRVNALTCAQHAGTNWRAALASERFRCGQGKGAGANVRMVRIYPFCAMADAAVFASVASVI
jgi:hypothetical protein